MSVRGVTIIDALIALGCGNCGYKIKNNIISGWTGDKPQPSEEEIQTKLTELRAAEPMRLLREERNRRIAETDWMANSDVTMSGDWKTYRQTLRDLPSTAEPKLDENGQLTNVTWPTKPT